MIFCCRLGTSSIQKKGAGSSGASIVPVTNTAQPTNIQTSTQGTQVIAFTPRIACRALNPPPFSLHFLICLMPVWDPNTAGLIPVATQQTV